MSSVISCFQKVIVTTCPPTWARKGLSDGPRVRLPLKENARSRHQRLFEENVRKTKKDDGLHILKMRVQELFMHGEGISTPRARHKRRQPLIECASHNFKIMYFPFLCFLCIFPLLCFFLSFWGLQGRCPRSYVSSSAMRKSDQRSSLRIERWLNCLFIFFERLILTEQKSFKALDFKMIF